MKKALLSFVFIALAPVLALADTVSLALENDTLSFPKKDSEYTHGTELTYMADSGWWVFNNIGFEIEQTKYGPKLDNTDTMKQGEHPYCGYLSLNLLGDQYFDLDWSVLTLQHSLGFGLVGPHSYSEQSQKIIHAWLGCKEPKGWKKWQIRDEFIAQYELYANLNIKVLEAGDFGMFVIPRAGVQAGGFKDALNVGVDLKFGFNVPYNVGSGIILSAPAPRGVNSPWSCYLLAGVESKCIFHDTAIEGGFFRDSPYTLDAEPWVGEFHWGVGVKYRAVQLEYANIIRTKEFETNDRRPNYGRLVLTVNF